MTSIEIEQAIALDRCRFSPGTTAKRFVRWAAMNARVHPEFGMTPEASAFLDKLAHQYRKQIGRCMSVQCDACAPPVADPAEVQVALDAFIEGRAEYNDKIARWVKVSLARYNAQHRTKFLHPYEYATKAKPQSRRAVTLGDIYCRYCGEQLFARVKRPHDLVRGSASAQRHLTICALLVLCGMRACAKPGYRTGPMEALW